METGAAAAGQTVQFLLNMSENVTVTGAGPTLTLSNGGVAIYNATDSTGTELEFDYTVGADGKATDLETPARRTPAPFGPLAARASTSRCSTTCRRTSRSTRR